MAPPSISRGPGPTLLRPASLIALLVLPLRLATAAADCCTVESFIDEATLHPPATTKAATLQLPASANAVTMAWPIDTFSLNSPFGPRQLGSQGARYDWHRGTDLRVPIGTPVKSPADAVVVFSGVHPAFSDPVIQLRHNTTAPFLYTLYLHMSETLAVAGETIAAGTVIGLSGQGTASYPHLHWEARLGCLRQECCQQALRWMPTVGGTPPPAPVLAGFAPAGPLGTAVLLEFAIPREEIDLQAVDLRWGATARLADLDALNALSPTGAGAALDDPLFFDEKHATRFALLPARFNDTFPAAGYRFLAWDLAATPTGEATVRDAGGRATTASLVATPPPAQLAVSPTRLRLPVGGAFELTITVVSSAETTMEVALEATSAQSHTLTLSPDRLSLAPRGTGRATVRGTLSGSLPTDVGDVIVVRAITPGATPLVAATLVDTGDGAAAAQPALWFSY